MYITTAISYLNGEPHAGHLYEIVVADILSKYNKHKGEGANTIVHFQTGTDEHGQKIASKAESVGLRPIELCEQNLVPFKKLYQDLNIGYDNFIRTTDSNHYKTVQHVFDILKQKGDIYMGKYEGWYSSREEKFITEHQAKMMNYKDEVTGKSLERIEEDTYLFRMSKYEDQLKQFYVNNPNFISDEQYSSNIIERLDEGLRDLSISRTNLKWGIDLGDGHVCYVWFDALLNYLSGINYFGLDAESKYNASYWQDVIHVIGKDITWFHGVIWIVLLMALEIELPKQLVVHGFITDKDGVKMSKSLGNVIDPFDLLKHFPEDLIRFYLIRYNNIGSDLKCNIQNIVNFNNGELADNIGNLVNRIVNLIHKFSESKIPEVEFINDDEMLKILDTNFVNDLDNLYKNYKTRDASQLILDMFHQLNLWLTQQEPWKLKTNIELRTKILRIAIERLYQISHTLIPVMPNIAYQITLLIGHKYMPLIELRTKHMILSMSNIKLEKTKIILFPKLDYSKIEL